MEAPRNKKHILVIEDEPDLYEPLYEKLQENGFVVSIALDGEEGLRRALAERPDVILLDIIVPNLNGRMVLQRLREDDIWGKNVPVILLTNQDDERNFPPEERKRANRYMLKADSSLNDIVGAITEVLTKTSETQTAPTPKQTIHEDITVAAEHSLKVQKMRAEIQAVRNSLQGKFSKSTAKATEQEKPPPPTPPPVQSVQQQPKAEPSRPQLPPTLEETPSAEQHTLEAARTSIIQGNNMAKNENGKTVAEERITPPAFKENNASEPEGLRNKAAELFTKASASPRQKEDPRGPGGKDPYRESVGE